MHRFLSPGTLGAGLIALSLGLSGLSLAQPSALSALTARTPPAKRSVSAAESASIKGLLEQKFPGAKIETITRSPVAGLYEVQFDDQIIYTDGKVSYVFVGSIYEADSKRNLTEERVRQISRVSWDALPLDLAIKKVKGNGQRKLVVFADADCPFCAKLENELRGLDNVTVYTFVFPIDTLHPDAARKSRLIWCAPDRVAAWDAWFEKHVLPDNAGDCETPLEKTKALALKLRVQATPTLVFVDGSTIPGAIPGEQIDLEMDRAETALARAGTENKAQPKAAAGAGG